MKLRTRRPRSQQHIARSWTRSKLFKMGSSDHSGNGTGKGFFRQIRNRLANAAKVRDLPEELSKALGVPRKKSDADCGLTMMRRRWRTPSPGRPECRAMKWAGAAA